MPGKLLWVCGFAHPAKPAEACVAALHLRDFPKVPKRGLVYMKLPVRSVAWVLPLFLTACFHRTHHVQSQQLAPPLAPTKPSLNTTPVELPPSATTIPTQPTENAKATPTEESPRRHVHHHRPVDRNTQEASNVAPDAPPVVSAIGQLSSGDPANYRYQTAESINTIERGLNGISGKLSTPQQKIADQIREFLKEARAALASGDVDGAHTLAAKAKVLLAELTK